MAMSKDEMVLEINKCLKKITDLLNTTTKFKYVTGTIPGNGTVMYDAPAQLEYNKDTHHIYSVGIELRMVDPFVTVDPNVIQATAVVDYAIGADGKLFFRNNHTAVVTYFARIQAPVAK